MVPQKRSTRSEPTGSLRYNARYTKVPETTVTRSRILSAIALFQLAIWPATYSFADSHSVHAGPAMNYHRIDDRLVTGGHLVGDGLAEIKAQGVAVVIDLRDEPPSGQREKYAEQGIEWINVPVVWRDPQPADFEKFREAMSAHENDHVMVQCAANYRASAMTYLYRVVAGGVPEDKASQDLLAVWNPNENQRWRRFIDDIKSEAAPD
ncbi:MAG: protein tyrosine phosphatase family protein [Gammaproteobacteria bacterium]|nr:protein tyrosine phosphatase family protein [Gammaproteobacteria bacterium]